MYQNKLNLSQSDILEKEFKIDTRGYRLKEVDQFLDFVIEDYNNLIETIKNQEKEKDVLAEEVLKLKQELRNANVDKEIAKASHDNSDASGTNVDVLKRISNLEKIIFGKEEN
jgi:DivIVA domain-containing protein